VALQVNHRQSFLDALENRWNAGYLRCLQHLQRLLAPMPQALLNQRLIFMSLYLNATLAAREGALAQPAASDKLWRSAWALDNLADSLCGLLWQAPGEATLAQAPGARPSAAAAAAAGPAEPAGGPGRVAHRRIRSAGATGPAGGQA
jgi:hypothetical protein